LTRIIELLKRDEIARSKKAGARREVGVGVVVLTSLVLRFAIGALVAGLADRE
jgi:hypothetical protein